MHTNTATSTILGIPIDSPTMDEAADRILALAAAAHPSYVCFVDAHMVVAAHDERSIRDAVMGAAMRLPDGAPIAWRLKASNVRAQRLSGPCTSPVLLSGAAQRGLRVGFYGGAPETMCRIRETLHRLYPNLHIAYMHCPPFRALRPEEVESDLDTIRASGTQMLFVGLGCPKQELWMRRFSPALPCVLVGVGAALKVLAGETRLPPLWMQELGLTWVIRFAQEPRRLASRIFCDLPRFLYLLVKGEQNLSAAQAQDGSGGKW